MSRKTYSYSAAAIAAVAGLSFSSADGAEAIAQDTLAQESGAVSEGQTSEADTIEIVPQTPSSQEITFVTNEVVQPVVEPAAPADVNISSLRELVSIIDKDAELTEQLRCLAGAGLTLLCPAVPTWACLTA